MTAEYSEKSATDLNERRKPLASACNVIAGVGSSCRTWTSGVTLGGEGGNSQPEVGEEGEGEGEGESTWEWCHPVEKQGEGDREGEEVAAGYFSCS